MKRKLFRQMISEWRSNLWLVIELAIVVVVMHWIFASLYTVYSLHKNTLKVAPEDIYVAGVRVLGKDCDDYAPYDSLHSPATDLDAMVVSLRSNPCVDIVSRANFNSFPFSYNFLGRVIKFTNKEGKERMFYVNTRPATPELLQIFDIRGSRGETPGQLGEMLKRGELIISAPDEKWDEDAADVSEFLGQTVTLSDDSLARYRVGAIAEGMRRVDYEPAFSGTGYFPLQSDQINYLVIRVKPGMGHRFAEGLTDGDMQSGNVYLTDMKPLSRVRDSVQLSVTQAIRNLVICALFILAMIFLGFLGTFWFRTQQRVTEVAIRKVNGARNSDIYARFFSEGLLLLAVAAVVALPVSVWMMKAETAQLFDVLVSDDKIVAGLLLAVAMMALLIVAGIFVPARRATRVDPAEALKDM